MAVTQGDTLPDATLIQMGGDGPEPVDLRQRIAGKKVVIFGVPGAFTSTCTAAHVPSFIRTKDQFDEKGIDEILCVAVNDPFVMQAWSESTGAGKAGIAMLADPASEFTKGIDMAFSAPPVGFIDRSKRYAMVVDDGRVVTLHEEEGPGVCDVSGGEALLQTL
ncbi:peroxiredoxin [Rhodobacteraceae bacterium CCMM004]|nr:peroxiredoxin [Rhodobacteraceae bacterium CCMM004]